MVYMTTTVLCCCCCCCCLLLFLFLLFLLLPSSFDGRGIKAGSHYCSFKWPRIIYLYWPLFVSLPPNCWGYRYIPTMPDLIFILQEIHAYDVCVVCAIPTYLSGCVHGACAWVATRNWHQVVSCVFLNLCHRSFWDVTDELQRSTCPCLPFPHPGI